MTPILCGFIRDDPPHLRHPRSINPYTDVKTALVAAILAGVATLALAARASWATLIVWVFNVWGAVDRLHAIYQGQIGVGIDPGSLGAAFFIPTVVVPPLLVTHGLIFWLLLRPKQ